MSRARGGLRGVSCVFEPGVLQSLPGSTQEMSYVIGYG